MTVDESASLRFRLGVALSLLVNAETQAQAAPYELESGKYYTVDINADGSAELALTGPDFFRNVGIDEVIINEIEVRPLGIDSLEFDDEGTAIISFVTIRPGSFTLQIPGTTSESQRATFNVK